ncbi:MAG: tRNA 4-thiouridine(8) synthase ThiI [Streptosporangiales bacterium]|nr:tRNA 4-thiouridine(8) synthase ThiI [Streptosporangiales bacterium]
MATLPATDPPTTAALPDIGRPCVLLKVGEIVLKGRNRKMFERKLRNNLRVALDEVGPVTIRQRYGVVLLEPGEGVDPLAVAQRAKHVIGLVWVHPAVRVAKTAEAAADAAVQLLAGRTKGAFTVRARRRDKRFPMTSGELAAYIGTEVQRAHDMPVNLSHPDIEVRVEVDHDEILVFTEALPGPGGLPVGVSGRALALLSGGIDSPVATYRMMQRGLWCDLLHFSGMPQTGPESIYKAYAVQRLLGKYAAGLRLWVIPFGKAQQQLASAGTGRLQIIAQRRIMLKTAEQLAHRERLQALVTGDCLGQVSSQTLSNMTTLHDAVQMPVLRPLVGYDKVEIIREARKLGTLAISELPDEDCCSLLTPPYVATSSKPADLREIERRVDATDMVDALVESAQLYEVESPAPTT